MRTTRVLICAHLHWHFTRLHSFTFIYTGIPLIYTRLHSFTFIYTFTLAFHAFTLNYTGIPLIYTRLYIHLN